MADAKQQPWEMTTVELIQEVNDDFDDRTLRVFYALWRQLGSEMFAGSLVTLEALRYDREAAGG